MSIRKGIIRIWLVIALVYIFSSAYLYRVELLDPNAYMSNLSDISDQQLDALLQLKMKERQALKDRGVLVDPNFLSHLDNRSSAILVIFCPPLIFLLFGWAVIWIGAGFSGRRQ